MRVALIAEAGHEVPLAGGKARPWPVLVPLDVDSAADPATWQAVASRSGNLTAVVPEPRFAEVAYRLAGARVALLGRVDAGYATRPVADLRGEVERWAGLPVTGVFLDRTPTSPFSVGPVAVAVRSARRAGLSTVVLNPGLPPDPLYRELGVPICSFDGSWAQYRRWSGDGSAPGDGHLVHSVPATSLPAAHELLRERQAGFGSVTDRKPPAPYAGLPAWLPPG